MFDVRGCREHKCWRGKKKSGKLICLAVLYVVFVVCNVLHRVYNEINKQDGNEINEVIRVKRNANIDVQKINGSLGQGKDFPNQIEMSSYGFLKLS